MDTIHNYLENMFMNMPKTEKVMKAKMELGQMMEDKYNELRKEGRSDNEAIGIVISEFGNINELAGDLGIDEQVVIRNAAAENARPVSMQEARDYIRAVVQESITLSIAVFCFIGSSAVYLILEKIGERTAIVMFFAMIACGVGMSVFGGIRYSGWSYMKHDRLQLDFETAEYVRSQRDGFSMQHAVYCTVGVILIVFSFVPSAVTSGEANIANASLFILTGIGVMLFIMAGMRESAYKNLLNDTAKDDTDKKEGNKMMNGTGKKVISVFWPTVTCIYICWSFITFDWGITWIVWPIAAAVKALLVAIFSQTEQ
jgi:hypothetical protein